MSDHICTPGCTHGITEENRKDVLDEFDTARRSFLRNTLVGGGAIGRHTQAQTDSLTMRPMNPPQTPDR